MCAPNLIQRYQPGAGWGSTDEDHLLPEDRAPLTGASGAETIDDLDDIEPSALGPPAYRWDDEGREDGNGGAQEGGWSVGPWTYAETFHKLSRELPRMSSVSHLPSTPGGRSPRPPLSQKHSNGVRSRVWWRVMVIAEGNRQGSDGARPSAGGGEGRTGRRESAGSVRRKVPHAASPSGAAGLGDRGDDRIRVPLERLQRAAVVGPSTFVVELEIESSDGTQGVWRQATLVVGPCDAPRLGSLLVERAATSLPRSSLGHLVGIARKLASAPPPLPPRPSQRGRGGSGFGGTSAMGSGGFRLRRGGFGGHLCGGLPL